MATGNEDLPREDEERLYREREAARLGGQDCDDATLALTPDVAPTIDVGKCDPPEPDPEVEFLPANPPPAAPAGPDDLPDPLMVYSQAASFAWYAPFVVCIEFLNLIFGFFEAPDRPKGDSQ